VRSEDAHIRRRARLLLADRGHRHAANPPAHCLSTLSLGSPITTNMTTDPAPSPAAVALEAAVRELAAVAAADRAPRGLPTVRRAAARALAELTAAARATPRTALSEAAPAAENALRALLGSPAALFTPPLAAALAEAYCAVLAATPPGAPAFRGAVD
jgi:aspartate/methionine/tyrosine aminotransferase